MRAPVGKKLLITDNEPRTEYIISRLGTAMISLTYSQLPLFCNGAQNQDARGFHRWGPGGKVSGPPSDTDGGGLQGHKGESVTVINSYM